MLINPKSAGFTLPWHRDDIPASATVEEEVEALKKWHYGVRVYDSLRRGALTRV